METIGMRNHIVRSPRSERHPQLAEPDEKKQFEEAMQLIKDAKCPCCGQPLIESVEVQTMAQQSASGDAEKPRA